MQINSLQTRPILILDFGSQYTQLIARRIREMGVYCVIYPHDAALSDIGSCSPSGLILSGGPASVTADQTPRVPEWVFELSLPILGICYGMQAMAVQLGGQVSSSNMREFGRAQVILSNSSLLLHGLQDHVNDQGDPVIDVWMSHGDQVTCLPPGFKVIGETSSTKITAMADEEHHWYGVQFHPEVTHTPQGAALLKRFILQVCHADTQWTSAQILEQSLEHIRSKVGDKRVLLGLSGGVDSSVVAALLHRAIGDQLVCVFVDTGLLRLHEAEQVVESFGQFMGGELLAINAESRFLNALQGITCPEEKRKVIGATFVHVFEEQAAKLTGITFLAQGTIYPDVIESAGAHAADPSDVIKSHHNVAGLPKNMQLMLLEPLRELFKDEVRALGISLGLPHALVYRHPFPGPGLGVRILGEVKKEYAVKLRHADSIFMEELHAYGLYHQVSQAFAVFLPIKSVGVVGDRRCYDHVICLRAVETSDFMTANWAHLPWDFLGHVSNRIINEVEGISRVTYDISGKPPATIEWE